MSEARRGRRRRLTAKVAARRHRYYIDRILGGDPNRSRRASESPHYWAKATVGNCNCRKRHHGAPRRDKGMCDLHARVQVYRDRARIREARHLIARGEDPDSDTVALLLGNRYVCDLW